MAKAELGPIVSSVAGSVAGLTFNRRAGGTTIYARPGAKRPPSAAQLLHRNFMTAAAHAWTALTPGYRQAWGTLAKQEQIPSYFSRGRRWTGRQLFTCFFLHASHQYTPLPSDWLPTSPIFFQTNNSDIQILVPTMAEPDPPAPDYWYGKVYFSFSIPLSLNPGAPDGTSNWICSAFWLNIIPLNQRYGPRQFKKIAPLTPAFIASQQSFITSQCGNNFNNWAAALDFVFGPLRGVDYTETADQPRTFDSVFRSTALSNKRLYWTAPRFCLGSYFWYYPDELHADTNSQPSPELITQQFDADDWTYPGMPQAWEP